MSHDKKSCAVSNIILAEYLGRRGIVLKNLFTFRDLLKANGDIWFTENELEFHENPEWITLVIKKIESIRFYGEHKNNRMIVEFNDNVCNIFDKDEKLVSHQINMKSAHLSAYVCCVNFIKYLNEHKKELKYKHIACQ